MKIIMGNLHMDRIQWSAIRKHLQLRCFARGVQRDLKGTKLKIESSY